MIGLWIDLYPVEFLAHEIETPTHLVSLTKHLEKNESMTYYNFCYNLKQWVGAYGIHSIVHFAGQIFLQIRCLRIIRKAVCLLLEVQF